MALRPIKYLKPLSVEAWERKKLQDIKFRIAYTRLGPEFALARKKIKARRAALRQRRAKRFSMPHCGGN